MLEKINITYKISYDFLPITKVETDLIAQEISIESNLLSTQLSLLEQEWKSILVGIQNKNETLRKWKKFSHCKNKILRWLERKEKELIDYLPEKTFEGIFQNARKYEVCSLQSILFFLNFLN